MVSFLLSIFLKMSTAYYYPSLARRIGHDAKLAMKSTRTKIMITTSSLALVYPRLGQRKDFWSEEKNFGKVVHDGFAEIRSTRRRHHQIQGQMGCAMHVVCTDDVPYGSITR